MDNISVMASAIYSDLNECFKDVDVCVTGIDKGYVLTGFAIIREVGVKVCQIKAGSSIWQIVDEEYSDIEDLEENACYSAWDGEYWEEYIKELKDAYDKIGMPEEHRRFPEEAYS